MDAYSPPIKVQDDLYSRFVLAQAKTWGYTLEAIHRGVWYEIVMVRSAKGKTLELPAAMRFFRVCKESKYLPRLFVLWRLGHTLKFVLAKSREEVDRRYEETKRGHQIGEFQIYRKGVDPFSSVLSHYPTAPEPVMVLWHEETGYYSDDRTWVDEGVWFRSTYSNVLEAERQLLEFQSKYTPGVGSLYICTYYEDLRPDGMKKKGD